MFYINIKFRKINNLNYFSNKSKKNLKKYFE